MKRSDISPPSPRSTGWTRAAFLVFAMALVCSWLARRELDTLFDRLDEKAIAQSQQILEHLLGEERKHRVTTVSLLAEDARLRSMVLTPEFDQATAMDLLADIKATANANVVAVLDGRGTVRSVLGADELHQVNLGTSSLVAAARKQPTAKVWAFDGTTGVLAAAPIRLGGQVRAIFLMGFALESERLTKLETVLGPSSAVYLGRQRVAVSGSDPERDTALRAAATLATEQYTVLDERYLATNSQLSDFGSAIKVAWLAPMHRHSDASALVQSLTALPAIFAGLMLAILMGLTSGRARTGPSSDRANWTPKENES